MTFRLDEASFVDWIPPQDFIEWAKSRPDKVVQEIVGVVNVPDGPLPEVVRFLIANYPASVGHELAADFLNGGWRGSEVSYLGGKLRVVEAWMNDEDESVRTWARDLADSIKRDVQRAKLREEHEDLPE